MATCTNICQPKGIHIISDQAVTTGLMQAWLATKGMEFLLKSESDHFWLDKETMNSLAPDADTTGLFLDLGLNPLKCDNDLEFEIVVAMLMSPITFHFASYDEFVASVHVRRNIVKAARNTQLAFDTENAERPEEYWDYSEQRGFFVKPGRSIIEALERATQPDSKGSQYAFSCYRATEYVALLAIAQELELDNPSLLQKIQKHCEARAIKSRIFHETFLHEYGTLEEPLPARYYVPGDRVWFRNPDERSADICGYEGSWVFYLGGGCFSNFWDRSKPYTLERKCLEIYHWRDALVDNGCGEQVMDEGKVDDLVLETLADRKRCEQVLARMIRYRDPAGVCADGGCIDYSREYPRQICPGSSDIVLPEIN